MLLTPQQRLDEARSAYHALNTGKMARVVVDQNGERVEFAVANKTALYNYIKQLEREVGANLLGPMTNGPAQFLF